MDAKEKSAREKMMKEIEAAQKKIRDDINKEYGDGSSFRAYKRKNIIIPRISSGSLELDHALGGGWPRGRISLAWGPKSSGKTTTFIRAIADAQNRDTLTNRYIWSFPEDEQGFLIPMKVAVVDIEGTFDFAWAQQIGVDLENLEYTRPQTQEEGVDIIQSLVQVGRYDVVMVDSIAAMSPEAEIENSAGKASVGKGALLNNKMFRKLQSVLNAAAKADFRTVPTILLINQERFKVGVVFGDPRVKPGGEGQNFFSSIEVMYWPGKEEFWDGDTKKFPKQKDFNFKIAKNKVSAPHIQGKYTMALSDDPNEKWKVGGLIEIKEVMDFASRLGVYQEIPEDKENKKKKIWIMYDKEYSKKKDVMEEWCLDTKKFIELKQDLMSRLFPGHS